MGASFPLWETKLLQANLIRAVSLNAALVLVKLVLVLPVVALDGAIASGVRLGTQRMISS